MAAQIGFLGDPGIATDGGHHRLKDLMTRHPAAALAALGALSALASTASWDGPATLLLPGVWFGLVLATGAYLWQTRNTLRLLAVFAATCLAWWAAYHGAALLDPAIDDATHRHFTFAIDGLAGGLVGSAATLAALSLGGRAWRGAGDALRTVALGTLAGLLLECAQAPLPGDRLPIHWASVLPLFLGWQIAVAASIAHGLRRR